MNMSLVEFGDNFAVVSDKNGDIKIVNKSNSSYPFDVIFVKENELEVSQENLKNYKNELEKLKTDSFFGNLADVLSYVVPSIFIILGSKVDILLSSFVGLFAFGFCKFYFTCLCGSRRQRKNRMKELINLIKDLEINIPKLENDLSRMKEAVNHCVVSNICKGDRSDCRFEHIVNSVIHHSFPIRENVTTDIRVRRLVPKDNNRN